MTRRSRRRSLDDWGLVISLTLALAAALILGRSVVSALAPEPQHVELAESDPTLILVKALVAEAGYSPVADHTAILHVLRNVGGRAPRSQALQAVNYCSVFKPTKHATKHRHQVGTADWAYMNAAAPTVSKLVKAWVRGAEIADPCGGRAVHWGSVEDMKARRIDPAVYLDCGGTRNVFISEWKQL